MAKEEKKDEVLISPEQAWDVITFTKGLLTGVGWPGGITPQVLSRAMKNVSFEPQELSETDLTDALKNPKDSEERLRKFMEYLEIVSMPIKRIISYEASHLAFDLTYTVKGDLEEKDYKSKQYIRDKGTMMKFLDEFNWHYYFQNALKQLLRNEIYAFATRDDGDKIVLQELPIDMCRITGRHDYGFLISFDFSYFLQAGVDIRFYPHWFRKQYAKLFSGDVGSQYMPPLNPELRGTRASTSGYWVDVPPDVAWVFKLDSSLVTAVPYLSGLMPEFIQQSTIRSLQKDINMATASRMLVGQVPMRDSKTNVRDMIAIDPDTLGKFLSLVASSLSDAVGLTAAPLENMKTIEFGSENNVYDDYLRTSAAVSGLNSNLFYTSGLKANTVETMLSHQSDSKIVEALYAQFDLYMEYQINKRIRDSVSRGTPYQFAPRFEGNDYYLDRERRFSASMELANMGIVLPQKMAASQGLKPQELERMMTEAKASGFVDKLTPITPAFQQAQDAGRPQKDDSELSDAGAETRSSGANMPKGGKEI